MDVAGSVGVAVTRLTGIFNFCPAARELALVILLRVMILSSLLLNLAAMPASVSPGKT